jgi:undecaprenyl-diphosphatase
LRLPAESRILVVVVVLLVVAGVVLWLSLRRDQVVPQIRRAVRSVVDVLRQPTRALQLFGGSAGVTGFYLLAFFASLEAFRTSLPLLEVTAVFLGAAAVASVAPTSGGLGAMEAALVAGLSAFGASLGPAIAGVLAFRLVTFWLPILPGWMMFRHLTRREVI